MRIITVPNSLNAETGSVCSYIGDKKDLESLTTHRIVGYSDPSLFLYGYPEPAMLDMVGDEIYACMQWATTKKGENCGRYHHHACISIVEIMWSMMMQSLICVSGAMIQSLAVESPSILALMS